MLQKSSPSMFSMNFLRDAMTSQSVSSFNPLGMHCVNLKPSCSSPRYVRHIESSIQTRGSLQSGQLRCSQERTTTSESASRLRTTARMGALRSKSWISFDASAMSVQPQQPLVPGAFQGSSARQIAEMSNSLGPRLGPREGQGTRQKYSRGGMIRCEAIIGSNITGAVPDEKSSDIEIELKEEERVVDGSVLTGDGSELRSTLRLVECAMLAATAGLAYFLSNLLRLEAYFGCFFPLPVVISSMRWGAAAGRKTMVATAMLLLILSGPLKAASYLLLHGFVGLAMGAFWKWELNWGLSIAACTVVRCLGALGFVLLSSWLLRDNILALITMNAHASVSYMLAALGVNVVPTMPMIYLVFASLLVVNCGSFVFLLHVLYAIFLRRLGMRSSISVPGWVERAM